MKSGILIAFCVLALATLSSAAHLSMRQMAMIWKQGGGHDCQTAVAIGYATSMGNPQSRHRSPMGGVNRGLWGINTISAPHVSANCALSAECGAQAAIRLSGNGADWSKFPAFVSGMHMSYMPQARQACGPSGFDLVDDAIIDNYIIDDDIIDDDKREIETQIFPTQIVVDPFRRLRGHNRFLTMHQMAMLWKRQGGMDCQTAIAVGYATSMGNKKAKKPSKMGGKDRGLWGINSVSASHVSSTCATSPDCATQAAINLSSNGADWSKFSAYVTGMHMAYMGQAKSACRI